MMKPLEKSRLVYSVNCPGCGKRLHAPSLDERRRQMARHMRNCNALKKSEAMVAPEDVSGIAATAEPMPDFATEPRP